MSKSFDRELDELITKHKALDADIDEMACELRAQADGLDDEPRGLVGED